ncbi:MAG TPA: KH domain-containing protein [Acidimicrobiales bacterium]|nr:KH domain-containing protein [Acidimicrobiales bacterium]
MGDELDDTEAGDAEPGNEADQVDDEFDDEFDDEIDDEADDARSGNEAASSAAAVDDMAGNRIEGGTARGVLDYVTRAIATEPDSVVVEANDSGRYLRFAVHVAPSDMGRMIGRRGRVAQAIRTVVRVAGSRDGVETNVDFVDD